MSGTTIKDIIEAVKIALPISETLTSIVLGPGGTSFTYTNEAGVDVVIPLPSGGGGGTDVYVDSFTINSAGLATLTRVGATPLTAQITFPPDVDTNTFPTALVVSASGVVTLTLNDGSALSAPITFPAGGGVDVKLTSVSLPDAAGIVTFTLSDGSTLTQNISSVFTCLKVAACFGVETGLTIAYNAGTGLIDTTVTPGGVPTPVTVGGVTRDGVILAVDTVGAVTITAGPGMDLVRTAAGALTLGLRPLPARVESHSQTSGGPATNNGATSDRLSGVATMTNPSAFDSLTVDVILFGETRGTALNTDLGHSTFESSLFFTATMNGAPLALMETAASALPVPAFPGRWNTNQPVIVVAGNTSQQAFGEVLEASYRVVIPPSGVLAINSQTRAGWTFTLFGAGGNIPNNAWVVDAQYARAEIRSIAWSA